MRHYILFLILFLSTGIGQIKVLPMGEGAMRDAFLLEQKGELETAQKIYESIFIANPKNRQNFNRLKRIYQRQEKQTEVVALIQDWLIQFPNDIMEQIDLGKAMYQLGKKEKAKMFWQSIEKNHNKSVRCYNGIV